MKNFVKMISRKNTTIYHNSTTTFLYNFYFLGQCEQKPTSTLRENRGHEHDLLEILDNFLTSNADEDEEEDETESFGSHNTVSPKLKIS